MYESELESTIKALCASGKGILAADESPGTLGKRLKNTEELSHLENVEETRRRYREILVTSDTGGSLSGVILHEETLLQSTAAEKKLFVDCLKEKGILAGIKVDQGLTPLSSESPDETSTKGLDTLGDRCDKYREQGARFAKWRSALKVTDTLPSQECVSQNAKELAEYAKVCEVKLRGRCIGIREEERKGRERKEKKRKNNSIFPKRTFLINVFLHLLLLLLLLLLLQLKCNRSARSTG